MGPKWDPNRIFDAEAFRKPLGGLLERSWKLLEPKKVSVEASWSALGALKGGRVIHGIFGPRSGSGPGRLLLTCGVNPFQVPDPGRGTGPRA